MFIEEAFLRDPRFVDRAVAVRNGLIESGQKQVDARTLAEALDLNIWQTLFAIRHHKAWDKLGLNEAVEYQGPHTTYH